MVTKSYIAVVALVLSSAGLAGADEVHHKATGLKFTVPEGWTCTQKGDEVILTSAEKSLSIAGGVIPMDSAKAIFDNIEKFLGSLDGLSEVKVTEGPEEETEEGLDHSWYSGTAHIKQPDGATEEIEWDLTKVGGGKNILFLVGLGKLDDNDDVYEAFFASIEKDDDVTE